MAFFLDLARRTVSQSAGERAYLRGHARCCTATPRPSLSTPAWRLWMRAARRGGTPRQAAQPWPTPTQKWRCDVDGYQCQRAWAGQGRCDGQRKMQKAAAFLSLVATWLICCYASTAHCPSGQCSTGDAPLPLTTASDVTMVAGMVQSFVFVDSTKRPGKRYRKSLMITESENLEEKVSLRTPLTHLSVPQSALHSGLAAARSLPSAWSTRWRRNPAATYGDTLPTPVSNGRPILASATQSWYFALCRQPWQPTWHQGGALQQSLRCTITTLTGVHGC